MLAEHKQGLNLNNTIKHIIISKKSQVLVLLFHTRTHTWFLLIYMYLPHTYCTSVLYLCSLPLFSDICPAGHHYHIKFSHSYSYLALSALYIYFFSVSQTNKRIHNMHTYIHHMSTNTKYAYVCVCCVCLS